MSKLSNLLNFRSRMFLTISLCPGTLKGPPSPPTMLNCWFEETTHWYGFYFQVPVNCNIIFRLKLLTKKCSLYWRMVPQRLRQRRRANLQLQAAPRIYDYNVALNPTLAMWNSLVIMDLNLGRIIKKKSISHVCELNVGED